MEPLDILKFVNKWLHLLSVIAMFGGVIFAYIVLRPASRKANDDVASVLKPMWRAFGISLGIFWLVVLVTGFLNYGLVMPTVVGKYHMYAGLKMLLALTMFGLTFTLYSHGSKKGDENSRPRDRGTVLSIIILLGILAVGLSAVLTLGRINGSLIKKADAPAIGSAAG